MQKLNKNRFKTTIIIVKVCSFDLTARKQAKNC